MKFKASTTYSETTPESAEHGEFSDTGFIEEDIIFDDLRELIEYMQKHGFNVQCSQSLPITSQHAWFSTQWFTNDYSTGTDRQESIHIKTSAENLNRIAKLIDL